MTSSSIRYGSTVSGVSQDLLKRYLTRFQIFQEQGGKFRVAILNRCNLDCFFCHNEAMENPRLAGRTTGPRALDPSQILEIINAYTRLGGRQVNLTGGEPLAHPDLMGFLSKIEKHDSIIALNTNAVLAGRLLRHPVNETIDCILASLHTTDNGVFQKQLGGKSVRVVMDNIVALRRHGYTVEINYSLGPYNRDAFGDVLDFAVDNDLFLKCIAFVRPDERPDFYGGEWVDPLWIERALQARGGEVVSSREAFGGFTTTWSVGGSRVKVKNIAQGRLETDFCKGCPHASTCGEGIYGVRVGVDGLWKPCLLRSERFSEVNTELPMTVQILRIIDAMIGDWSNARFRDGAPV